MRSVVDTHIVLRWFAGRTSLSSRQRRALHDARPGDLALSDISLWEIATLQELGRIRLHLPLRDWLERLVTLPQIERVGISPAIAAEVATLPATFHRDPADRIIVATTRVLGGRLITQDRRIIESGLVPTLA